MTFPGAQGEAPTDEPPFAHPYFRFSLPERDRRWIEVRSLMERHELAAIVAPPNTGHATDWQADARYLSGCGGGLNAGIGVVFPLEGDVTVFANAAHRWGPGVQVWVDDVREVHRRFGSAIADRLTELRLGRARIGIVGLGPGTRSPEGTIVHGTLAAIRDRLPRATLVPATDILQEARERKSEEEILALRLSTRMVEAAITAQTRWAQPGVPDHVVWAETMHALFRRGSEFGVHFNWRSGPNPLDTLTRPTLRTLEAGDIIRSEVEASVAGYRAQQFRPVAVHRCPPVISDLAKIHEQEFYPRVLELLRSGSTAGDLVAGTVALGPELAPRRGPLRGMRASMTLHGRGLGDDRPLLLTRFDGSSAYESTDVHWDLPFPENGVYICKPTLHTADGSYQFRWGDTVRATPAGAVRLGTADPGVVVSQPRRTRVPRMTITKGPGSP